MQIKKMKLLVEELEKKKISKGYFISKIIDCLYTKQNSYLETERKRKYNTRVICQKSNI